MCRDLFETVERSQQSESPIILTGVDIRPAGVAKIELVSSLDSLTRQFNVSISSTEREFFFSTLKNALAQIEHKITKEDQDKMFSIISRMQNELTEKDASPFWIQELKSLRGFLDYTWNWWIDREKDLVDNNLRDIPMAQNSLWLLNEKYEGEKMIIWAANGHIAKTDTLYEVEVEGYKPVKRQFPMGEVMYDSLGKELYSLGFISYHGSYSILQYDEEAEDWLFVPKSIDSVDSSCLEFDLKQTGFKYAFLNLKGLSDPWLNEEIRMRMWRPDYVKGKLPDIYDGIFYIETMEPNVKIE